MADKKLNYFELGVEEFKRNHPRLIEDLAYRAKNEADSLGLEVRNYHEQLVHTAYADNLTRAGVQNFLEYHVNKYESDPLKAREVIADYHKAQADALGISWEEYKVLNRF